MNPTPNQSDRGQTGKAARFTAKNTMLEVLTVDPSLGMVLMRDFHLGGCSHCGFNPHDTVEDVAAQNGIPAERLLAALNRD